MIVNVYLKNSDILKFVDVTYSHRSDDVYWIQTKTLHGFGAEFEESNVMIPIENILWVQNIEVKSSKELE